MSALNRLKKVRLRAETPVNRKELYKACGYINQVSATLLPAGYKEDSLLSDALLL